MIEAFRFLFAPPRHLTLLLAALWLGLYFSEKRVARHGLSRDALNSLIYFSLCGYLIGGRVLFVLANWSVFTESQLSIFSINVDLFDPFGALVTALFVGFLYGRHSKLPLWPTLDALTPIFATVAIGASLAHLAAGTAFGKPTTLAWSIELWNATRHPSQIYELSASLIIFGWVWFRKKDSPAGSDFLLFTALAAGSRLFLEAFRGDSTLIFGGLRLAQVSAWIILAAALFASEIIRGEEIVN